MQGAVFQDAVGRWKAASMCPARVSALVSICHALRIPRALGLASLLSMTTGPGHRAGNGKPFEQQVAMIAQKIIDAKHAHEPGRRPVAATDA